MKRLYEGMFILTLEIGEKGQEEIFQKITKRIESLEGKVLNSKVWAKERNFTFFLKGRGAQKKRHTKGTYWLVNFYLDIEKMPDLKETVRLEENILRSLILNIDKPAQALASN